MFFSTKMSFFLLMSCRWIFRLPPSTVVFGGPMVCGNSSALRYRWFLRRQGRPGRAGLGSGNGTGWGVDSMASLSCHWLGLRHLTIPAFKWGGMERTVAAGPGRRGERKFCWAQECLLEPSNVFTLPGAVPAVRANVPQILSMSLGTVVLNFPVL